MNQKRSKLIRKLTGFKVHKPREYKAMVVIGNNGRSQIIISDNDRLGYQNAKKDYYGR